MDKLVGLYRGLIDQTETIYLRYLHNKVDWNNRLTAIVGARGTGKTTLLLQHIKLHLPLNDTPAGADLQSVPLSLANFSSKTLRK